MSSDDRAEALALRTSPAIRGLFGRSLLKDVDLSTGEFTALLDLAAILRRQKRSREDEHLLDGRNVALIFEKTSTRTRSAFEVASHDQGAHVTYLGPGESQLGHKESVEDTAKVLGRMYDGIEFRGFDQRDVELLAAHAGVPVWNGLTDQWHPTQLLADVLTMRDHSSKPISEVAVCYCGDGRNNTANSILAAGALVGMDVRIAAPAGLQPSAETQAIADRVAASTGARMLVTSDVAGAVVGADFIYTDVWLSMGEPAESWGDRISMLLPYQVNAALMALTGNPEVKLLHCLPALHNTDTEVGAELAATYGVSALEVTDEVFRSKASIVFDQAENRLHTIKALLVATLVEA